MSGVFQALVVVGLFLLTAVVGLATVVMVRRGHRDNTTGSQSGTAYSTGSTLLSIPSSSGGAQIGSSDADQRMKQDSSAEDDLEDLRAKAKTLLASDRKSVV